jgi:hypothetical protein
MQGGCEGEVGQPHRVPSTRVCTNLFGTDSNDRARSSIPINLIVLSGSQCVKKVIKVFQIFMNIHD